MIVSAVILCAGVGSRIGLMNDINKCAADINGTSAVRHGVKALFDAGAAQTVVVTGHAENSVKNALCDFKYFADIRFVRNSMYDFHGCNYSVACGVLSTVEKSGRIIIAEGDSLIHPESIRKLTDCNEESAVLVRSPEYINPKRSVTAIGIGGKITRYAYDQNHTGQLPELSADETIIGESMQLWSFSGAALRELSALLAEFKKTADKSKTAKTESGVYSINMMKTPAAAIMSNLPDSWLNINTGEDLEKAKGLTWIHMY